MPKQAKRTKLGRDGKPLPAKPYRDYPLFPHQAGQWAKKIKGRMHYFGRIADDPEGKAAVEKYQRERDDLHAGRTPRTPTDGLTVKDLVNRFLTVKEHQKQTGEIVDRTFRDYFTTCANVIAAFGKERLVDDLASDDFQHLRESLAKTRGAHALGNEVQRTRVLFKFGFDSGLIDKPMRYGPAFKRPSRKVLRRERAEKGERMMEARHVRRLLKEASVPMRAMILLAVNAGFGNHDVGTLPMRALDLRGGWVNFPRPKTQVDRRCPLWPVTVAAIEAAIKVRPGPWDSKYSDLVFVTRQGRPWGKDVADSPVTKEFRKLLDRLRLYRAGLGFYSLRHVFRTIGDEAHDQPAVNHIMGHLPNDMASVYRERINDDRLRAVTDHVHHWLLRMKPEQWQPRAEGRPC